MPKVSDEVLVRIKKALDQYEAEIEESALTRLSKNTYILHADQFVRWLKDDFEPGATLSDQSRSRAIGR